MVLRHEGAHRGGFGIWLGEHSGDEANEADVEVADELLHGKEQHVYADAGYTGADKRSRRRKPSWHIAAKRGRIAAMPDGPDKIALQRREHAKLRIRARVEHPFQTLKVFFRFTKVRFKGLAKNTAHIVTLFALANLHRARKKLMASIGVVRPLHG